MGKSGYIAGFKHTKSNKNKNNNNLHALEKRVENHVMKKMGKPETKVVDSAAGINVPSTGNVIVFVPPQSGTSDSQRIGDRITIVKLCLRGQMNPGGLAGDSSNVLRLIVGWDLAQKGSNPTTGNILSGGVYKAFYTDSLVPRFKILFDKCYAIGDVAGSQYVIPFDIELHTNHVVSLSGNAGTSADYASIAPFVCVVSDSAIAPHPLFDYTFRMVFTDL